MKQFWSRKIKLSTWLSCGKAGWMVASIFLITTIGCSLSGNSPAKSNQTFQFSTPSQNCLSDALPVISDYFQSRSNPTDVANAWDCATGALDMFVNDTVGATNPDSYTPQEIRAFLEKYFLGNVKISDQLLQGVMQIKTTILGGDANTIKRSELLRARNVLVSLKEESLKLQPYIAVILLNMSNQDAINNPTQVENAIIEMNAAIEELGTFLNDNQQPYAVNNIAVLMQEIQKLYTGPNPWTGPQFVIDNLPVFEVIKGFLLNVPDDTINPNEWQPLVVEAGRLYALYIRSHYLLSNRDLLNGPGLDQLTTAMNEVFDLLQLAINAKPNKTIAFQQINDVIDQAVAKHYLNWPLRAATLESVAQVVAQKVCNPPIASGTASGSPVRPIVLGYTQAVFDVCRTNLLAWVDMERVWRAVQTQAWTATPSLNGQPIPLKTIQKLWPAASTSYKSYQQDLLTQFTRAVPLAITDSGTVNFQPNPDLVTYDQEGFDSLNWKTGFARVVVMGWAADPVASYYTGITIDEFHTFFEDVKQLGVDLQFVEPNDDTLWNSTFQETAMFMLSSDGGSLMNFWEGTDFIAFAMSSSVMTSPLYSDAKANCAQQGVDPFNRPTMDVTCFRARLQQQFPTAIAPLPNWVQTVGSLNATAFAAFEQDLEAAGRSTGFTSAPISDTDIGDLTMVMQYIEALFVRYDTNHDQILSYAEALQMYPLFHDILQKASGFTDEGELTALFAWILKNGSAPSGIIDEAYFITFWQWNPGAFQSITADRLKVVQIIAQLKSSSAAANAQKPQVAANGH